jgi:DNA-binding response OmpR family regulator
MHSGNPLTVVMLEPDVIVRTEISEFLRECGYHVIEGVEAEDLRVILQSGTPVDVVLSEVRLSGSTSGFQLAQELRQTWPQIVVILVSGISNVVEKASDLCGRGPLKKPYRPEEILRRIEVLVGRRNRLSKAAGAKD